MKLGPLMTVIRDEKILLYDLSMLTKVTIDNSPNEARVAFYTELYDDYMDICKERWNSLKITVSYDENPAVFCSLLNIYRGYERFRCQDSDKHNNDDMDEIKQRKFPKFRNISVKRSELAFPTSDTNCEVPASLGIDVVDERTIVLSFYKELGNHEKRDVVLQKGLNPELDAAISIYQAGFDQMVQTVPSNELRGCELQLQSEANERIAVARGKQRIRLASVKQ